MTHPRKTPSNRTWQLAIFCDDEASRARTAELSGGGSPLSVILGETLALLGQVFQQGCRIPVLAMLLAKLENAIVDLREAGGIGVPHGASAISREAVPIDIDN